MTLPESLTLPAQALLNRFDEKNAMLATAESCTGGLIAGTLTALAGSSSVVERGFVTYSNDAKAELLGVPPSLISELGAVSGPVAKEMAEGALARSKARISVAVTGVAGPGASENKPAGLVYIAASGRGQTTRVEKFQFPGDRDAVRHATVLEAFRMALDLLDQN